MPRQPIVLLAPVEALRQKCLDEARSTFDEVLAWLSGPAQALPIHDVERGLQTRLMAIGRLLVSLWLACRLPTEVVATMTHGRASYRFCGLKAEAVRSRFGEVSSLRPVYERVHGEGPATIVPQDRAVGLAAGRMTLGVHLLAGYLAAKMAFDEIADVIGQFASYAPSKRAILGIVDLLGPLASSVLENMPVPDDDGEILVVQNDDKGVPMLGTVEHEKRCKPHKKRGRGNHSRGERKRKRRANPRVRRPKGKKSKNARMGKVFVIYTLRRNTDGTLEGPINKRVIATFKSREYAFGVALREALKRGYGKKPTYFLADGSRAIWSMQQKFFPLATPCVDWYHVCEYLWKAGGVVHAEGSAELANWVHARKVELMAGRLDDMLAAMTALRTQIGKTGPGTKGRRKRLGSAIGYLTGQRERLRYRELSKLDMDIATGAVEGAVNHAVGRRLDGSMMRWSMARAEHIVALRCVVLNGLWDHFSDVVATAHGCCRDPVVLRITPIGRQVPYDAVRKAA